MNEKKNEIQLNAKKKNKKTFTKLSFVQYLEALNQHEITKHDKVQSISLFMTKMV